jgi:phage-related protein
VARKLAAGEKPLFWVGSSREDLMLFPDEVKDGLGAALSVAQFGGKHPSAKFWKGEGPGVLEVVDNFMGGTYRAVYTVRFAQAVYVLHGFQKKSPRGLKTSQRDVHLISRRLMSAQRDYEERYGKPKS